jgi:hypothetical protein
MPKFDLKKELKEFYKPSAKEGKLIRVPKFQFLKINGINASPQSADFQNAIQALFTLSYKIKFSSKTEKGLDYVVMPLEGLWWADDMDAFIQGEKEKWRWTLMIMQPGHIDQEILKEAKKKSETKVSKEVLDQVVLEDFEEGWTAQILHIGPFAEEGPNIQKLHQLIHDQGGQFDGHRHKHHEIYLSDFRRVAPEKMKTILRQPFLM